MTTNIDVLNTEESIVSNLMRHPNLIGKLKLTPDMFQDEGIKTFIQYIYDAGKVDVNQIYYKSREDKQFISTKRLGDIYNSNGTDKVFFMQDQMNLLQNYVINEAKKQANEFNSMPTQSNFNYLIEQLQQLSNMRIDKDNPTDNYLMEVMDNILSDKPKDFIKTGIKSIDNKIMGFERGQLNVLGARPSLGGVSPL